MTTKVSGDAAGGWIVEFHDGDRYGCYPVMAETEADAVAMARRLHEPAALAEAHHEPTE